MTIKGFHNGQSQASFNLNEELLLLQIVQIIANVRLLHLGT